MKSSNDFWKTLKNPFFVLAPMESVTDTVFRRLVKELSNPDVLFTEFVNTDGLCSRGKDGVIHRLRHEKSEKPIVAQLWGNSPEHYYKVCQDIKFLKFDGVDINLGCSVPKVVKNENCGALINNPSLVKEIVLATKEALRNEIPVSVKTRLGYRRYETQKWGSFLLSLDLAAITIHGRTVRSTYAVPSNWDEIKKFVELKNEINKDVVIIGNGDVTSYKDGLEKQKYSGVDGIMIGRAAVTNPYIFSDVPKNYFLNLPIKEKIEILKKHAKMFQDFWQDEKDFRVMKRFYKTYFSGFDGASEFRVKSMSVNTYDDFCKFIEEVEKDLELSK
ncbi:MAG: tRNA-dihydrouridine synthase [Bdellovibrionota bacterium]|nr:tRNA-dihydrouridine synthase [Pseudomonadota bacterium]MDY6091374.1 tRNA-dihydrouridine synthase [Bdellovibrionota bacterium]